MQRIRVLHLIDQFGTGGAQRDVIGLCRHVDRVTFEQEVWTLHGDQATMAGLLHETGVAVSHLGANRGDPSIVPRLVHRLRSERFDILQTHIHISALFGTLSNVLARQLPLVVTVDASPAVLPVWTFWVCYVLPCRLAEAASVANPYSVRHLTRLGVPHGKIHWIPHGTDFGERAAHWRQHHDPREITSFRARWGLHPRDLVLLSVARLHPERRLDAFLRAFSGVVSEVAGARLVFVGDGPNKELLHKLASELGLSARVVFAGFQADPLPFYLASDLFLTISVHDHCGIAPLEAMACGLPVLALDLDARNQSERLTVVDGPLVFARAGAGQAFAAGLRWLVLNHGQRRDLGRRAELAVRRWGTLEARAKQHESLYRKLVARKNA